MTARWTPVLGFVLLATSAALRPDAAAAAPAPAGPVPLAMLAPALHSSAAAGADRLDDSELDAALERLLAEVERSRQTDEPVTLDWKAMAALNYRTGDMPASLQKLNGVTVRVPGFMVPLEDSETRVTEFLLVPYFGACIHVPPPPPNQMAHVLMQRNQVVDVNLWDPIWIVGKLTIENVDSPYGMVGYQVSGERILPYEG